MIKSIRIIFVLKLIISYLISQALVTDPSDNYLLQTEFSSIKSKTVSSELYYAPFIEKKPSKDIFYNIALNKSPLKP